MIVSAALYAPKPRQWLAASTLKKNKKKIVLAAGSDAPFVIGESCSAMPVKSLASDGTRSARSGYRINHDPPNQEIRNEVHLARNHRNVGGFSGVGGGQAEPGRSEESHRRQLCRGSDGQAGSADRRKRGRQEIRANAGRRPHGRKLKTDGC